MAQMDQFLYISTVIITTATANGIIDDYFQCLLITENVNAI